MNTGADLNGEPVHRIAQILAGFSGAEKLPFGLSSRHFQEHAAKMDEMFEDFRCRYADPFSRWAEAHRGSLSVVDAVFYPFSGPDFTFANLLYPEASTYLLCGLESCELLPEWGTRSPEEFNDALGAITAGMRHFLKYSYFITKDMREAFAFSPMGGVLPSLLVFLVRTGHRVESVDAVWLDGNGTPLRHRPSPSPEGGICIRFSKHGSATRRVYYFQQDLRDEYCRANGPFLQFAGRLGETAAFAKSASYLLHEPYFSNVRDLIFSRCSVVVQDPSSVPYRCFAEHGWNVDLHGSYVRTLPIFKAYEQPDLARASIKNSAERQPLRFGIGYLHEADTSSLMVAMPGRVKGVRGCEEAEGNAGEVNCLKPAFIPEGIPPSDADLILAPEAP